MKSSRLPKLNKILKRTPGKQEVWDIIEFLPQPTFLLGSDFDAILMSNDEARKMVLYQSNELENLPLRSIFPFIEESDISHLLSSKQTKSTTLVQHSGMQINVNVQLRPIGNQNHWSLLTFEKDGGFKDSNPFRERENQKWQAIQILSKIGLNPEKTNSESLLLQAGSHLTGANLLGLYLPASSENGLVLVNSWGKKDILPRTFSTKEIKQLNMFQIWKTDKNSANKSNASLLTDYSKYIATIPLNDNTPMKGILLVADNQNSPPIDLNEQLNYLVTTFSSYKKISKSIKNSTEISTPTTQISLGNSIENIISDGLILVSDDLEIINFNSPAEDSLGYTNSEVVGERLEDILIGIDSIISRIQKITLSESLMHDFGNVRIRRRDSHSILLHIRAIPIVYDEKNILAILISDRSKHEEILAEANRLKEQAMLGELTATFAHEVRNPINNISTSLQLLEIKHPDDEEIQKQIGRMKHDCDRLTVLINKILSYSKITEHILIPLDFKIFIENLMDSWQYRLEREKIESRLNIPEGMPKINADENALEQVFANLISNAARAMREQDNGVLGIKVESVEDKGVIRHINIIISDNGPGIPKDIQEKIFKPFFTTNNDGTGLGLAVSKRIISSHNGEITLKSFPAGTIFNIKLPTI